MKTALYFLSVFFATLILGYFAGWLTTPLIAFVATAFMYGKCNNVVLQTTLACILAWLLMCLVQDIPNHHILSKKISVLIIKKETIWFSLLATTLIGFLISFSASLSGMYLKKIINK
jgi:hypothetical protein